MNKASLVDKVIKHVGVPRQKAQHVVNEIFDQITNALARNESVALLGFGAFKVKYRPERSGKNPQTGEAMMIKASNVPSFKAGSKLKDSVNP